MDRAEAGEIMESCLADEDAHAARLAHARVTAEAMRHVGDALQGVGSVLSDDATRGLGLATRMGGALGQGTCDLLDAGNSYAAAALTRQLVEIEYLLWTFADEPEDCARWLNASRSELERDFKPAAMRKRSDGASVHGSIAFTVRSAGIPAHGGGFCSPTDWIAPAGSIWANTWSRHGLSS